MNTLAIVGKSQLTRSFAPFEDPNVDVWAYNDHPYKHPEIYKRISALFEMHDDALTADRYSQEYKAWLREKHPFTIVMHDHDPEIPSSWAFPRKAIGNFFMNHIYRGEKMVKDFYTSSTPYALALALHQNYTRIELYGVELSTDEGWYKERDCAFFCMGQAAAHGVDVIIHPLSKMFDVPLYGKTK